ncbi:MAG: galactose mutarotase [Lentisphaeria bacterium]|nr:galactose mutarotase [Lentisphaeria bacterium]
MKSGKDFFTLPDGRTAKLYTLRNSYGAAVDICDWGGIITAIRVPARNGVMTDVALGWKDPAAYIEDPGSIGALVGRVANRIARGRFVMDGVTYQMVLNDAPRPNMLHGGFGYSHRLWRVAKYEDGVLVLNLTSPHGDAGFPGDLEVEVIYSWNDACELGIEYRASGNADTPVNLTNHAYFNLNGEASNEVDGMTLRIAADEFNPVDENLIPTGVAPVGQGVPDLRRPMSFPDILRQVPGGLDHNYIIGRDFSWKADCVTARSERTGIVMTVSTDRTGVQVYMGGGIDGYPEGKHGVYRRFAGFCLETQEWPDALNHPEFPSILLRAGREYHTRTIYRFSTDK